MKLFSSILRSIRHINRRYAKPEIEMTLFVRVCLFVLRLYLFILIGVFVFKFAVTVNSGSEEQSESTQGSAVVN